ncbi:MAG: cation:proton antiporter [Candidatus Sericytochromatia bacterium]|nr:cation:proton antiporter [Candidatus Tanganyikabacteria bacterium]
MPTIPADQRASILCAILAMLVASRVLGWAFRKAGQPRVVGEILGGVVLGPTLLGEIWPGGYMYLFHFSDATESALAFVAWLGLTFLMFSSGMETQDLVARPLWRRVALITLFGTAVPLVAGYSLGSTLDLSKFYGTAGTPQTFGIFLGMAIAITAIPVLSRILMDLGLLGSGFGRLVMAVALIEDLVLWAGLAILLDLGASDGRTPLQIAAGVLTTFGFFGVCYLWGHKALGALRRLPGLRSASEGTVAIACLIAVMLIGYAVGVRMIFGAFLAGRIVSATFPDRHWNGMGVSAIVAIFFASVGVRLDLQHGFDPWLLGALLAIAVAIKTAATFLGARLGGVGSMPGLHLAVVLNARGALGIVLATIGYEADLINGEAFTTLVLLAVVSSLLAGAWLHAVKRRHPEQLLVDGAWIARADPGPVPVSSSP